MTCLIFVGVIMRYVFYIGASFAEPSSIFFAVQLTMYGAAACYRAQSHLRLHFLVGLLPIRSQRALEIFVHLLMAAIAVAILAAVCVAVSRPQLMAWVGLAIVASVALFYVEHQYRYRSPAGFGWVVNVDAMHHRTLAALVLIAMGLVGRRRRSSRAIPRDHSDEPVASGAV